MGIIKIGDRVAYSADFLRSIADYSKRSADKRGHVTKVEIDDKNFKVVFVDGDFGHAVNIKNLRKVKNNMVIE